jgi:hypothetical protein
MSVAVISLCSFLSGVGSCAAFGAALKTGMRAQPMLKTIAHQISNPQLADTPWIRHSLPLGCLRVECILLHCHSGACLPWRHS